MKNRDFSAKVLSLLFLPIVVFAVPNTFAAFSGIQLHLPLEGGATQVFSSGPWFDSKWVYRKKISTDNSQVSGSNSLTNFPLLIKTTDVDLKDVSQISNLYYQIDRYNQIANTLTTEMLKADFSGAKIESYVQGIYHGVSGLWWAEKNILELYDNNLEALFNKYEISLSKC